jgi:hypothetical protein
LPTAYECSFIYFNRIDEHQSDSISITSSPISYESSSVSSLLTDDKSLYPRFTTPQLSNPQILSPSSSDIQTPNVDGGTTSTLISPDSTQHKIKSKKKSVFIISMDLFHSILKAH